MTYADRDQLYRSAVEALGREEAETLMSSLPPMDWSEIATKVDLDHLEHRLDARFEALDARFESFEHRLSAHVDRALRQQTQWVFGAVVLQAVAMILALSVA